MARGDPARPGRWFQSSSFARSFRPVRPGWKPTPDRGRSLPTLSRIHMIRNVAGSQGVLSWSPLLASDLGWPCGIGRAPAGSGLLDQHGSGVEQVEPPALHVLLRLGPRLRGNHGDVEAGATGDDPVAQRGVAHDA